MEERIRRQLDAARKRLRSIRFLYVVGAAWIILWVSTFIASNTSTNWTAITSLRMFEVAAVGSVILALVMAWLSNRDDRKLARRIERRFPDLKQRLLTAIDQKPSLPNGRFGYLQTLVAEQTLRHGYVNNWQRVVGNWTAVGAWLVSIVGFLGLVVTMLMLRIAGQSSIAEAGNAPAIRAEQIVGLEVIPGNAEIEKGTNLLVTAKFGDKIPGEALLVIERNDADRQTIPMIQSLDDPLFGTHLPVVNEAFSYTVRFPGGTSPTYRIDVFELPKLARSDAELDFPAYTRQAKRTVQDTIRVTVVEGTNVAWQLELNKPVESARLIDDAGNTHELAATDGAKNRFSLSEKLTASKKWRLELVDSDGRKNKELTELTVTVTPNQRPDLQLTNARDVSLSALEELMVGAKATDDYGIERAGLSFTLADQEPQDVVLGEQQASQRNETISHKLDMESLRAEPDHLLAYHFWVEDFGPDGKLRRTPSDMFFAEVRHFEEIFREGQSQSGQQQSGQMQMPGGQQSEQLAEMQKQIINATWRIIRREVASEVSAEFADDVHLIAESQEAAIEQLREMTQRASSPNATRAIDEVEFDMKSAATELNRALADRSTASLEPALRAERKAYQGLLKLRSQEHEVVQGQPGAAGSASGSRAQFQQQLQQLQLQNDRNRYENQREAQQRDDSGERQVRQILNRLKDLARRQEDLNKQLNELQAALQAAQDQSAREEIERQLKRLRDQQEQMLADMDELESRMAEANQEAVQSSRQAVEQTRQNVQQAAESLRSGDTSQALAAGTRAEQKLKDIRDRVRRESTNQFSDRMRELRGDAREIAERQQQLNRQLEEPKSEPKSEPEGQPSLRSPDQDNKLPKQLAENREKLSRLFEKLQGTVEQSEPAEPLLSRKLYETLREAYRDRIDENLQSTQDLVEQGFKQQARPVAETAGEGINELKESLEEAATSVLGNETEGLRRAIAELDTATKQLEQEIKANAERGDGEEAAADAPSEPPTEAVDRELARVLDDLNRQRSGEPAADGRETPNSTGDESGEASQDANNARGESSDGQPGSPTASGSDQQLANQPNGESPSGPSVQESQSQGTGSGAGQRRGAPSRQSLRRADRPNTGGASTGGEEGAAPFDGVETSAPLTGDGFRNWSDRLRDVEEMVEDARLRNEAAGIRDRAREMRRDYQRHAKVPEWSLVEMMIAQPMRELRQHVAEELLRRSAEKNAVVPIDRDPVPDRFAEQVRRYYEQLGSKE